MRWIGAFTLLTILAGCGAVRHVQRRHATEYGCPEDSVRVTKITSSNYSAVGCGVRAIYVCVQNAGCIRNSEGTRLAARESPPVQPIPLEAPRQPLFGYAREDGELTAIRATFRTRDAELVFTYWPSRSRRDAFVSLQTRAGVPLSACHTLEMTNGEGRVSTRLENREGVVRMSALRRTTQSGRPAARFCGRSWSLTAADMSGFERFIRESEQLLRTTHDATTDEASNEPAEAATVRALRDRLNAHADSIRACSGAAGPIPIEVIWRPDELVVRVRGNEDVAVDACIMDAIGAADISPTTDGRLIHVVR